MEKSIDQMRKIVAEAKIHPHDQSKTDELTRDFGFVKFDNDPSISTSHLSYYIRLALNTDKTHILQLFEKAFQLSKPNLIISVTGGAKYFHLSPRLNRSFQQGLIQAAKTTNAWIITAGTNAGVVKQVGEAFENYQYENVNQSFEIPLIGISYWNYIQDFHLLENQVTQSETNLLDTIHEQNSLELFNIRSYVVEGTRPSCCGLESHHSHFLLFDDHCSRDSPSIILKKRAELEKEFQSYLINNEEKTPLVLILVEGGPSSVRTICEALLADTPVLIIDGSGRAADLLAEVRRHFDHRSTNECFDLLLVKLMNDYNWFGEVKDELLGVLADRWRLVSVYQLNGEITFEEAILQTLFNATQYSNRGEHHHVAQMKLAISWNKLDYAKKLLDDEENIVRWETNDLTKCLYSAIVNNRTDFIDALIHHGISFEQLKVEDFHSLYTSIGGTIFGKGNVSDRFSRNFRKSYEDYLQSKVTSFDQHASSSNANELFLWALLTDRFDLAKYLSSKILNPTVGCLVASKFYRFVCQSSKTRIHREIYKEKSLYFGERATKIIDRCFDHDEFLAIDVIKSESVFFDYSSASRLAADCDERSFLTSKSFQTELKNQCFDRINYRASSIRLKIFLCAILLPLCPIFAFLLPLHKKVQKVCQPIGEHRIERITPMSIGGKKNPTDAEFVERNDATFCQKYLYFFRSPIVRFYNHGIFFCLFLLLFSYVSLYEYDPIKKKRSINKLSLSVPEIVLHIWIWTLLFEEIRQFILLHSFVRYVADIWNKIDLITFAVYLLSFSTRLIFNENFYLISKISFCICLILCYIRLLHYFAAYEQLGPKLAMIYATMKDLTFFLCFIGIFLCGFSVSCVSLLQTTKTVKWIYDDHGRLFNVTLSKSSFTWQTVQDLLSFGVWKVFAQVDPIEGHDLYSETVYLLTIVFVILANVLLLNVLIAFLSIESVQNDSYTLWRYQSFLLIQEFAVKSPIPPPFNLLVILFDLVFSIVKRIIDYSNKTSTGYRATSTEERKDLRQTLLPRATSTSLKQFRSKSNFDIVETVQNHGYNATRTSDFESSFPRRTCID